MALTERSVTEQRYEAVIQVVRHELPVTEVAERFGVSRQSVHTWIRRYQQDGLAAWSTAYTGGTVAEVEAKIC